MTGMALVLASAAAFAAVPAHAQESKTPMQIIDEARANERLQVEKQYDAIKRGEGQHTTKGGKFDPWAGARSADNGSASKGAASKTSASRTAKSESRKGAKKSAGSPLPLR